MIPGQAILLANMIRRLPVGLLSLAILLLLSRLSLAQGDSYLRFIEGENEWQGKLQTAITRYRNDSGQVVELIAAVHVADPSYFDQLNQHFESLHTVLFELITDVKPMSADTKGVETEPGRYGSTLGLVQTLLADFLDLEFQLLGIDYSAENFRHADLSAAELRVIMDSKDESFFSMFIRLAEAQLEAERNAIQAKMISSSLLSFRSLLEALSADNQAQALKYLIAQELARSGGLALRPEIESELTILGDRNRVALDILDQSLDAGMESVGLFYGAAHMPGLARELTKNMGFRQTSQVWLTAWQLTP